MAATEEHCGYCFDALLSRLTGCALLPSGFPDDK